MKYGLLSMRHPDHDPDLWAELRALYRGGKALTQERRAELLPRVGMEHPRRHRERRDTAQYINYFGPITNYIGSALFARPLMVEAATDKSGTAPDPSVYDTFADDADRRGTAFQTLVKRALLSALVCGRAFVAVDFPAAAEQPATRAEEKALGLDRPYAFEVEPEEVIDWHEDDEGGFAWAILHRTTRERTDPTEGREKTKERFKLWRKDPDTGVVSWTAYEVEYGAKDRPKPDTDVREVGGDKTSFARVPIIKLELPYGLWIGNLLGPMAKEHFQRRSCLIAGEARSLFAIPVAKLGRESGEAHGEMVAQVQENPHRGDDAFERFSELGYTVVGAGDDIIFAEPTGAAFKLVSEQISELVDEMYRVVHQMAQSVSATRHGLARSGVSKSEDRHATEIVLGEYGRLVREFAQNIYDAIARGRGEDLYWSASGLDEFTIWDRAELVEEAERASELGIPSETFRRQHLKQLARRLLGGTVDPDTSRIIEDEIDAATLPGKHGASPVSALSELLNAETPAATTVAQRSQSRPGRDAELGGEPPAEPPAARGGAG